MAMAALEQRYWRCLECGAENVWRAKQCATCQIDRFKNDGDDDSKLNISHTFDPAMRTSDKLLNFGCATDIESSTATLNFKAYGVVKTCVLYYDSGDSDECWHRDQWLVFAKSPLYSTSHTNHAYHSIPVRDLRPNKYYAFIVEVWYRHSNERTHTECIQFRTRNEDVLLDYSLGLRLRYNGQKPYATRDHQLFVPSFKIKARQSPLQFVLEERLEANDSIRRTHIRTDVTVKMHGAEFTYLFNKDRSLLWVQFIDQDKRELSICALARKRNQTPNRIAATQESFLDYRLCCRRQIPLAFKLFKIASVKCFYDAFLTFRDEHEKHLVCLAIYSYSKKRMKRLKELHVLDVENELSSIYMSGRKEVDQSTQNVHSFAMVCDDKLFYTQTNAQNEPQLKVVWNGDYARIQAKKRIFSSVAGVGTDLSALIFSFVSNPLDMLQNSCTVDIPGIKVRAIRRDSDDRHRINIVDQHDAVHSYTIKRSEPVLDL